MNLFKIAKKVLSNYIYDPQHLKSVPKHYHRTERGWSDNKGSEPKEFYKKNIGTNHPYAMSFMDSYLNKQGHEVLSGFFEVDFKRSQNLEQLLIQLSENYPAREWITEIVENKTGKKNDIIWDQIKNVVDNYAELCQARKFSGSFSRLVGLSVGNSSEDWRMKKHGFKEPTSEMIKDIRFFQKMEQELILNTGLVDKSDFINIYRKTTSPNISGKYSGSFVESWSLTPQIYSNNTKENEILISTMVPLSKIIASSIGRGTEWIHHSRYEVLVDSSYLTNIKVIDKENIAVEAEELFNKTIDNFKIIDEIVDASKKKNFVNSLKLENLSDIENPTNEDLMELRNLSPEYREMNQTELIILFKTLTKQGFFKNK